MKKRQQFLATSGSDVLMNIKSTLNVSAVFLAFVFYVLSIVPAAAQTSFQKIIKDGKVTYVPAKKKDKKPNIKLDKKQVSDPPLIEQNKTTVTPKKNTIAKEAEAAKPSGKIVLFESSECNDCRRIRRFLYSNKVTYSRKDISLNKKYSFQLAQKTGSRKTPTLFIGNTMIEDLSKENLSKIFSPKEDPIIDLNVRQ